MRTVVLAAAVIGVAAGAGAAGCALFENEQVSKGRKLYAHYCAHCHGEHGRQNEGYNWSHMPDPRPKDLSAKAEMSTFSDEEIFNTISRGMKDTTPEVGDKIGDDEFAVPTMPTFKHTLSEEEVWSIVAYVRTLHGMTLTYDIEGRKKQLQEQVQTSQQQYDQAKQALESAEKAVEEAVKRDGEANEAATDKEREALAVALNELEEVKATLANFSIRPKYSSVPRLDLTVSTQESMTLAELGKRLYTNKYGCHACHRIGDTGGVVGPALDRAGFRLNPTWVFRWIKYPQALRPNTRMPNLGISDPDAKAITVYLTTLKAPHLDKPVERVSN